jgi:hypothetical protein
MDSKSNNITFSFEKSETSKYINNVEFAKTLDIESLSNTDDLYNHSEMNHPTHPNITNFDTFDSLKNVFDNLLTIEEQLEFSYVLPIVLDNETKRYTLPDYAEDLYHYKMNHLTGKPIPSFTKFDFSKAFTPELNLDFSKFDFTKTKLFKRRSVLSHKTSKPIMSH